MTFATSSSKFAIGFIFTRDNLVDYANEVECFYMFRFFDKNQDGYLDFEE